ncbi:MAG: Sulfate transport system permease protein CysW [Thermoanaerobaculia bacterium]|nr:Sulfate transport system permease protein CysW [Thermoanaerobaculia bacterium]
MSLSHQAVHVFPLPVSRAGAESSAVRRVLVFVAVSFVALFVAVPVAAVFAEGLRRGAGAYFAALRQPETLSALWLTGVTTVSAVLANLLFGLAAAWAVSKFAFRGKNLLLTLMDLPLAVSPVVAGLVFVLLYGKQGWFGPILSEHGLKVIFAPPGIILATIFVTFPLVVRELVPVMEACGTEQEEAALLLGATGWQVFWRVTLPNVKWGIVYGVILCSARAMGEFGAVSVVSGHIRGVTNTLPLHVEILYNEYQFQAAFAAASVLTILSLLAVASRHVAEWRAKSAETSRKDR